MRVRDLRIPLARLPLSQARQVGRQVLVTTSKQRILELAAMDPHRTRSGTLGGKLGWEAHGTSPSRNINCAKTVWV